MEFKTCKKTEYANTFINTGLTNYFCPLNFQMHTRYYSLYSQCVFYITFAAVYPNYTDTNELFISECDA